VECHPVIFLALLIANAELLPSVLGAALKSSTTHVSAPGPSSKLGLNSGRSERGDSGSSWHALKTRRHRSSGAH
jgi:hypothetical protein